MRLSTASCALAALLVVPATTMVPSALAGRDRTPEQDTALFQARKTWSKDSYQHRLDLLQSHQRCINAALMALQEIQPMLVAVFGPGFAGLEQGSVLFGGAVAPRQCRWDHRGRRDHQQGGESAGSRGESHG